MTNVDCPICLNELAPVDLQFPLVCPTANCTFVYCGNCLAALQQAEADGYQEASDGSHQVKVTVQCPQCRSKYESETYQHTAKSNVVVETVLTLRKAAAIESTLEIPDSELSASELGKRHAYLRELPSVEHLETCFHRLQHYLQEIGKPKTELKPLQWDLWKKHHTEGGSQSSSTESSWRDPTLFCGLEELLTVEEQLFVSNLLTAGEAESLSQAAGILDSITNVTANRQALSAVQQLSFAPDVADLSKVRKLYPLPRRMPRAVRLPVYKPDKTAMLKFQKEELALAGVRGPAGKVGLRRGDIVTHVNNEAVQTQDDFFAALERASHDGCEDFVVTVNADKETATNLQERSIKMKKAGVRLY